MKTNKLMTRFLSGALVALGFTACDNETTDDVYPLEYGSPSVDYRVKGIVTDEAGNPIENIRVIIRNAWDNTPNPYADDTVYNGGLFQSDSTNIADMEATLVEEGHGSWYQGKYEFEVQKKLKKKEGVSK